MNQRYFHVTILAPAYEIPVYTEEEIKKAVGYYTVRNTPHTIAYFLRSYVPIGLTVREVSADEYSKTAYTSVKCNHENRKMDGGCPDCGDPSY